MDNKHRCWQEWSSTPVEMQSIFGEERARDNFALCCDELEGGKERLQKLHRSGENPTTGSAVRSTEREEGSGI